MKELYIAAHEELIAEYLDRHPEVPWAIAYEYTADFAHDRMNDRLADMADHYKEQQRGI